MWENGGERRRVRCYSLPVYSAKHLQCSASALVISISLPMHVARDALKQHVVLEIQKTIYIYGQPSWPLKMAAKRHLLKCTQSPSYFLYSLFSESTRDGKSSERVNETKKSAHSELSCHCSVTQLVHVLNITQCNTIHLRSLHSHTTTHIVTATCCQITTAPYILNVQLAELISV